MFSVQQSQVRYNLSIELNGELANSRLLLCSGRSLCNLVHRGREDSRRHRVSVVVDGNHVLPNPQDAEIHHRRHPEYGHGGPDHRLRVTGRGDW